MLASHLTQQALYMAYVKYDSDVYVERKTNLDAAVAPVRHRATEHENRQSSLNKLTDILNFYQKVYHFWSL